MSILKDAEDLIQQGELISRHVTLTLLDMENVSGTLHTMTDHGVVIKTTKGLYQLYPWKYVMCIEHNPNWKKDIVEEKSKLIDVDTKRLIKLAMADGIKHVLDDTDFVINVDDNLNICITYDGSDVYDIENNILRVYDEEDINVAKIIAEKYHLEIERDYEE